MEWGSVGDWIKENGLPLVGALLTGGSSAAIATGMSMIQSATGESEPEKALLSLRNNPESMIKLKELTVKDDANIRNHLQEMNRMKLKDKQLAHEQTQLTIRNGDNAKGFIKWVRPLQASASLCFAMYLADKNPNIDPYVLGFFMSLPLAYGGLRTMDKFGLNPFKKNKS